MREVDKPDPTADRRSDSENPIHRVWMLSECSNTRSVIFTCENAGAGYLEARQLERLLLFHGTTVGLTIWLERVFEIKLACDTYLKRHLSQCCVPFEAAVSEIEGRRTIARLKRRFPRVC